MCALLGLGHGVIVDPAIAVARDLPAGLGHRRHRLGVARERHGDAEDRHRHLALGEEAMEAPEADTAAELVHRFDRQRAFAEAGLGEAELGQQRLRAGIAVEDAVLGALLVVDDELQGDPRIAGPAGVRPAPPVADHVAGIGALGHRAARSLSGRGLRCRGRRCGNRGGCGRSPAPPRRSRAHRNPRGTARRSRPGPPQPAPRCRRPRARAWRRRR